ncbi:MAG: CoA-binding protein [Spirochaetes bacterium]|nr:CoA-binding protein [Spirochaetota bacterium]
MYETCNVDFEKLFNPENIAFIGASNNPWKWGFIILANIIRGDFQGKIYPINPNYKELHGLECYPSLSAINDNVDLAVITVPAKKVSAVIDECIEKGVNNTIVITSDFSETGEEGARLEREISVKARSAGMGLVGPNTMGILNSYGNLNILMSPVYSMKGHVSIVSQSGNVGTQIMSECINNGVGVSKFISSGNEANIKCEDYIRYLGSDEQTEVIVLYIESLKDGKKFLDICREINMSKPIIFFKSGKTRGGMAAAASHTGAMAGSIDVYRSVFKQYGIIEAETTDEIIDLVCGFVSFPVPEGNRVGIVTLGGGWGVITADECEIQGLKLPELSREVYGKFDAILPGYWSKQNPVDMVAVASIDIHLKCLEAMVAWDEVDAVIGLAGGAVSNFLKIFLDDGLDRKIGLRQEEVAGFIDILNKEAVSYKKSLGELMRKYNKPILHVEIGNSVSISRNMKDFNYTFYRSPERAVRVLKKMYLFKKMKDRIRNK